VREGGRAERRQERDAEQKERARRMWARFLDLMREEGLMPEGDGWERIDDPDHMLAILRDCRRRGIPSGWYYENALEVADLDSNEQIELGLPRPTDAEPGSMAKLEIMAQRMRAGLEIHNPADRKGY
jgi:hypothetical protein